MPDSNVLSYNLNNGIPMPALGLGVFRSDPEETLSAVRHAIAAGYRLIDTAAAYLNEAQVGEAIRSSGVSREDIFVTTKLWMSDYGYDRTFHAFDRSLRKLGFDYLDLYLLHWPAPAAFDLTVESYRATIKLLEEGRVRAIGVCNFRADDLTRLIEMTGHTPAVNQIELHPFFSQPELRRVNKKNGIVTQAWSPIGGVNRYGKKAEASSENGDPLTHSTIAALAGKYGKTPAQIILRWQIEIGTAPIPKSIRPERITQNIDVFDFSLTSDEVHAIDALDAAERGGPDPQIVTADTFPLTIPD